MALFWGVASVLLFGGLGEVGLMRSESRWAEIVREMLASGNWLDPTLNGQTYFDKPLLSYWLAAGLARLTGVLDEWTLRLPSAASAMVVLWATLDLGRRLWNRRVALTAAWLLLLSYGLLGWGRLGEADMENLAFITAALGWYWRRRDATTFGAYLPFYALLFVGAHAKGLVAVAVPLLMVLPDLLAEGRWRRHLNGRHLAALGAGSSLYALPYLLVAVGAGGHLEEALHLVVRENLQRFFRPFDHVEPFYAYLVHWPTLALPWAPLLLVALVGLARRWRSLPPAGRWLLWATLLVFLFFSASGSRRLYYILPILPGSMLLMAIWLHSPGEKPWTLRLQTALLVLLALVEAVSGLLWPWLESWRGIDLPGALRWLGTTVGAIALAAWWGAWKGRGFLARVTGVPAGAAHWLAPALVLLGGYYLYQQPRLDLWRTARPFGEALRPLVQGLPPERIGLVGSGRPPLDVMFYARLPFPARRLSDEKRIEAFLARPGYPRLLIVEGERIPLPAPLALRPPTLREKCHPWEKEKHKLRAWRLEEPLEGGSTPSPDRQHSTQENRSAAGPPDTPS